MNVILTAALNTMVATLPYRILSYYPFVRQLRYPVWKMALIIGGSQCLEMAAYGMALASGGTGRVVELCFSLLCAVIYFSCIRADKFKLLFLYVFVADYIVIVRGLSLFIEARLFYRPDMDFFSLRSSGIQLAVFALTAPLIVQFLKRTKKLVFETDAPVFWRTVWLVPAFSTMIAMMFTWDLSPAQVVRWQFLMARALLLLCMLAVYYVLLHALDSIRSQAALAEQAAQQEQIIALQRRQHEYLKQYMEETRQAHHDLHQHLRIIEGYLDTGDETALADYIRSYRESLPADSAGPSYCKNHALDVVVRYYAQEAARSGIDFDVRIHLPEKLPIGEPEFCALIGNLLENAVDACRSAAAEAAFIRMQVMTCCGDLLVITADNTCEKEPKQRDGKYLSSKHEGFGIGTQSIRATAERHRGTAKFKWAEGEFHASVMLRLPATPSQADPLPHSTEA